MLEHLWLVTTQQPRPAAPTIREAAAAVNTSDVDVDVGVDQQLLSESAGCDSLTDVTVPNVPLPDVSLPDFPLPNVRLPLESPDGSVVEE